jgi:predicted RNA-binding protein (virulence factor B family)
MNIAMNLGCYTTLWVKRRAQPGLYLGAQGSDGDAGATVLLPNRDAPDVAEGTALEVFVYLDSEDRPIATTKRPVIALGEVAFLVCRDLAPFGAFFDWGLAKDLLVPKALQTREVRVGDRMPVGLVRDDTGRLAGTMRVAEMLATPPACVVGDWVQGQVLRYEAGIGTFIIIDKHSVGLVPATEPHTLRRGDEGRFRVTAVLSDGKVELSLRARAQEQRVDDGELIVNALRGPNPPRLGDHSDPDDVRDRLGISKKAFKRAVGGLLKERRVVIDERGNVALPK